MPTTEARLGPAYTTGDSFRARAEARQREYRADALAAGWDRLGHLLDQDAVDDGKNFVNDAARIAAEKRRDAGKGVAPRTFDNMLSSQAMCFNVFAPLDADHALAGRVLRRVIPDLREVRSITIEHTPSDELFNDQSALGGVDCDVLLELTLDGGDTAVVVIETKFVELEFSSCGFNRNPTYKNKKGVLKSRLACRGEVAVGADHRRCLYTSAKGYRYWDRTDELHTLAPDAIAADRCPFAGPEWQLWVNHTLAHAEAKRLGARRARFLVCAPRANTELVEGELLEHFAGRLIDPTSFGFVALEELITSIEVEARSETEKEWASRLRRRYVVS